MNTVDRRPVLTRASQRDVGAPADVVARREYQRAYYHANREKYHLRYLERKHRLAAEREAQGLPPLPTRARRQPTPPPDYRGRPDEAVVALVAQDQLASWRTTQVHLVRALTLLTPRTERLRRENPELSAALPLLVDRCCDVPGCGEPSHRCDVDYNAWHAAGTGLAPTVPPPETVRYLCARHWRDNRAEKSTARSRERGLRACLTAEALHRERTGMLEAGMFALAPYHIEAGTPEHDKARKAINRALLSSLLAADDAGSKLTPDAAALVAHAKASMDAGTLAKVRAFNAACRELHAMPTETPALEPAPSYGKTDGGG